MMRRDVLTRWFVLTALAVVLALAAVAVLLWPAGNVPSDSSRNDVDPLAQALDAALERPVRHDGPRLAIRPLAVGSDDTELAALADALCTLVSAQLARLGGVRVTACESARVALAVGLDDRRLARLLAVDHLLKGTIERLPDQRLRLTIGLIDVEAGHEHWRMAGDYATGQLQAVPPLLAQRAAATFGLAPPDSHDRSIPAAAYEKYLQALQVSARGSVEDQHAALRLVGEVLEIAPGFMPARVSQLSLRNALLRFPVPGQGLDPEGRTAELRALMIDNATLGTELLTDDPSDVRGHVLLANLSVQQRRWLDGFRHVDTALAQPTRIAQSLRTLAHLHAMAGYLLRARELALEAARLDPLNATNHQALALFHGLLNDTPRMRESARIAQELGDRMAVAYNGIAALREGDWPQAEAATVEALRSVGIPDGWVTAFVRGAADPAEREDAGRTLEALPPEQQFGMANFHWYHGWLGDTARTLRAVEGNLDRPLGVWIGNLWWPELDHLRRAPEFARVLDNIGLPALWANRGAPDLCVATAGGGWTCR